LESVVILPPGFSREKVSKAYRHGEGGWGPPEEVVTQTGTGEGKGEEEL